MADDVWAWCENERARPDGHGENQKGRLSDFHPQPVNGDDDPNEGEAASARPRPDPIGIPTTQRHSTRWRNAFELSSAIRQRSSGASSFLRCDRRLPTRPLPFSRTICDPDSSGSDDMSGRCVPQKSRDLIAVVEEPHIDAPFGRDALCQHPQVMFEQREGQAWEAVISRRAAVPRTAR